MSKHSQTANGLSTPVSNESLVKVGLLVRLKAKPGQEAALRDFLLAGLPMVQEEPETSTWFGIQLGEGEFGIFDTFANGSGRQAHLNGKVAAALMANAERLLAEPPSIETLDVLAAKLP